MYNFLLLLNIFNIYLCMTKVKHNYFKTIVFKNPNHNFIILNWLRFFGVSNHIFLKTISLKDLILDSKSYVLVILWIKGWNPQTVF